MRICIDASPALHRRGGIGRYTQELTEALKQMGEDLIGFSNLPSSGPIDPPFDRIPSLTLNRGNKSWRFFVLMAHLLHRSQDHVFPDVTVFHATDHVLPCFSKIKGVVTLHDFTYRLFPKTHTAPNRLFLTVAMRLFLRAASGLIADSMCTRQDAVRLYGVDPSRIRAIHLGVDSRFRPASKGEKAELRAKYQLPEHFVLTLGTLEPRKNLNKVLDAYNLLKQSGVRRKLVIAGKKGWLSESFLPRIRGLGLESDLIMTGFVPDEDLPILYSSADLFVFASLYEGFGLPVLEAMACQTPVACSNTSSLPEVAGDAALFFNPGDPQDMAGKIAEALEHSGLKEQLRERGLLRVKEFTWERTARETLKVYRQAIES
ncbi:MAG: glycosyltransferase family 1 protein [Acidobacteria bacterium]|nr:MAG: glycosyltransferase family 1 protein [Acidobacteriota bacterium]